LLHGVAAVSVLAVGRYCARRWPSWPGLLPAVIGVSAIAWWFGMGHMFTASAPAAPFALPPLPDPAGVPWMRLLQQHGVQLVSLALLMAVVNSLDVVVYYQELELEHGVHMDANASLRRESLIGIACGAVGLIPASTSASRTRIVIAEAGPSSDAGTLHAVILLLVAVTGHVWLHFVPMAALAGALIFAGYTQVPAVLWSRDYKRAAPDSWVQSWLVAVVFSAVGGAGALLAGLVLATLLLLRSSASNALRRALLDGQARSRRLRRAANEAWIAPRMNSVAVIELQGVMSFGVAAHMAEHVRALLLLRHDKVLIAANRVPAWDATALVQLQALPRDLATQGRKLAVCGLDARASAQLRNVLQFTDLDRGLEWAEDQILSERPLSTEGRPKADVLGELGEHLDTEAHDSLLGAFQPQPVAAGACIFNAGDQLRDLYIVEEGQVTMSTLWPPDAGLRLATIGQGMTFGEMAFLNGEARTACAGAGHEDVHLLRLSRDAFERWAEAHPQAALTFMSNLALIGTRRLASTTRQLRAVLE
jgi:SulP family sulfate permease